MTEPIQEFVDSRGVVLGLQRDEGLLTGVKLLGLVSRNGRTYRETALREAASLYEGVKVNVNHPKGGPQSPRDYQDRIGAIRNVQYRAGEGLFGDLHFNPKHQLSEQLMWDAEHAPKQVGFSHNVLARTARSGEGVVVEAITKVESVDLVADPATTQGLFEQATVELPMLESVTIEELTVTRPDLVDAISLPLREQIEQSDERLHEWQRRVRIMELLSEHGLPIPGSTDPDSQRLTSDAFVTTLLEAASDEVLEERIADRAAAVRSLEKGAPVSSREQRAISSNCRLPVLESAADFAAAILH